MNVTKDKKGQLVIDNEPMRLTGKAGAKALAELETGVSTNPKRDAVLERCRELLRRARGGRR